ncbi:MAG: class I SAM-dependent methyltransferase [Chitinophagaceae bacterium]|jgi:2-polyprenyl-3-methyl-5-hydroxy-6-metoxy-1,4-benzoquinol methylase|nr:class I SAM-dependent methyltransferase [Chitinophagaceae bacterium]
MEAARNGDKVAIAGNYQYRAITQGHFAQRWWHKLRLTTAVQLAGSSAFDQVLDIGSGSGTLLLFLPDTYNNYTGIDANEAAVSFCKKQFGSAKNEFIQARFEDLNLLAPNTYSHIFLLEAVEHITTRQGVGVLNEAYRLLIDGGKLIITTPNRKSFWPLIEKILDLFKLTPRLEGDQHEHLYSKKELTEMVTKTGFLTEQLVTSHLLAPWLGFAGSKITEAVHNWEVNHNYIPGNLITAVLLKPKNQL